MESFFGGLGLGSQNPLFAAARLAPSSSLFGYYPHSVTVGSCF